MKALARITVVDVLVVIAILMILSAILLPHFAEKYTKLNRGSHARPAAVILTTSH